MTTVQAQIKRLDYLSGADVELVSSVMNALVEAWRGLVGCGVMGGMVENDVFLKDGLAPQVMANRSLPDAPPDKFQPKRPSMIGATDPRNTNLLDFDVFNTLPTAEDLLFSSPTSTTASKTPSLVAPPTGDVGKHIDNNLLNLHPPSGEGKGGLASAASQLVNQKTFCLLPPPLPSSSDGVLSVPSDTIFPFIKNITAYLPDMDEKAPGAPKHGSSPEKSKKGGNLFRSGKGKETKIRGVTVKVCKEEVYLILEKILRTIKEAVFCGVSGAGEGDKTEKFLTTVGYTLELNNLAQLCRVIWRGIENGCAGSWGALKEVSCQSGDSVWCHVLLACVMKRGV